MEKTLTIDGRQVRFRCTAGTLIRYRNQFNREFIADMAKMSRVEENPELLTLAPFYDLVWVMAKTADDSIPDPLSWYDSFDSLDITDVYTQLQELVLAAIKTKNPSAAAVHPAAKGRRRKRR